MVLPFTLVSHVILIIHTISKVPTAALIFVVNL
jgi:hypothetical protein